MGRDYYAYGPLINLHLTRKPSRRVGSGDMVSTHKVFLYLGSDNFLFFFWFYESERKNDKNEGEWRNMTNYEHTSPALTSAIAVLGQTIWIIFAEIKRLIGGCASCPPPARFSVRRRSLTETEQTCSKSKITRHN